MKKPRATAIPNRLSTGTKGHRASCCHNSGESAVIFSRVRRPSVKRAAIHTGCRSDQNATARESPLRKPVQTERGRPFFPTALGTRFERTISRPTIHPRDAPPGGNHGEGSRRRPTPSLVKRTSPVPFASPPRAAGIAQPGSPLVPNIRRFSAGCLSPRRANGRRRVAASGPWPH